jgi:hypothetical protein
MTTLTGAQKTQFIDQGYVQVPGLLPPAQVAATRNALCASLGIAEGDPATWEGKPGFPDDAAVLATTIAARTEDFESVAEQLVGPDFLRGICYSPFLEWRGKTPVMAQGYIPVLTYPTSGAPEFVMPSRDSFHIDGGESIRAWPGVNFLAVMVYLTDVAEHGGATVLHPGSHRQVFTHWLATDCAGAPKPPALEYAPAIPVAAKAGDALFMHYLMVHSGSANRDTHIRVGLNTAVMPHPARPYRPKTGPPEPDWTPLDHTLRTDI